MPGGSLEVRIEMRSLVGDAACEEPISWDMTRVDVGFCGIDDAGAPFCRAPIPRSVRTVESRWRDWDGEVVHRRVIESYAFGIDFDAHGRIAIRRRHGRPSREARALLGVHRLTDLSTGDRFLY